MSEALSRRPRKMRPKNLSRPRRRRQYVPDQLLFSLGTPRLFLPLVKSQINGRIRRNSNGLFILYDDHIFVEVGFVRIIFAIFPSRAHPSAVVRDHARIAHVA